MSSPDITIAEREAVNAVLNTPNLSMGNEIQEFEKSFRKLTGSQYAIGVNSGTAGLHLCIHAADIREGDLVITTPFSFVASANVILYEKAIPVFVDVEPATGNLDVHLVESAIKDLLSGGTAANKWLPRRGCRNKKDLRSILAVDVFGQPADMDPLMQITRNAGIKLIEDSCEALGAEYKNRKAGTLGDYGVFAFYPNKQITTGEGGVILTDDDQAAAKMVSLRNQGRTPGDTWLNHSYLGYNYRLDEMSAALGRVQMNRIDELLEKRAKVAAWYNQIFAEIDEIETPQVAGTTTRTSWFVYVIRLSPAINRNTVAEKLKKKGIPARPYFVPIHLQPYMVQRFGYKTGDFPVTEDLGERGLALPFSSVMKKSQVDQVCSVVKKILVDPENH